MTEALARTDVLSSHALRRGVPVWTVADDLLAAVLCAAAVRDPARAATVLARLPSIARLRLSLRRLTLPCAPARQLPLL